MSITNVSFEFPNRRNRAEREYRFNKDEVPDWNEVKTKTSLPQDGAVRPIEDVLLELRQEEKHVKSATGAKNRRETKYNGRKWERSTDFSGHRNR